MTVWDGAAVDWYAGIWCWDGKSLKPLVGVAVPMQRSDYLLSADYLVNQTHYAASNSPAASASK